MRGGLTNEEIAQHLGISRDGAKYHVSEILSKLGVSNRRDAAGVEMPRRLGIAVNLPLRLMFASAVGATLLALVALAVGVIEMGGRAYQLEAINAAWQETTLPLPTASELERPFQGQPSDGREDLWRAYVVRDGGNPELQLESRRLLTGLYWAPGGDRLSVTFVTRLQDDPAAVGRQPGFSPLASGFFELEPDTRGAARSQLLRPSIWFAGASKGGTLAFMDRAATGDGIYLVRPGGGASILTGLGPQPNFGVWSPATDSFTASVNAVQLAAPGPGTPPRYTHYLVSPGKAEAYRLGETAGARPAWSLDGKQIAFVEAGDLVIVSVHDGSSKRVGLGAPIRGNPTPQWSRSGRYLSIGHAVVEARTGQLLSGPGPSFIASEVSPDGRWLAVTLDPHSDVRPCPAGKLANETKLRDLTTGADRTLVSCDGDFNAYLTWLANGRILATGTNCWGCEAFRNRLSLIDTQGGVVPLTDGLEEAASHYLAPDGRSLLVTGSRLRVYSIDGALEREISAPPGQAVLAAAWSQDGRHFAYIVGPPLYFI